MGTSAIESMMSLLSAPPQVQGGPQGLLGPQGPQGPQGPMAPVQQNPVAAPGPNPVTPAAPSMVDRIHHRLSGLLDSVRPSAPAGYDGLLSPEEMDKARPSFLQSLIGSPDAPSASARYEGNLNHILEMKQLAAGLSEHKRVMDVRQQMAGLFPSVPNETQAQMNDRLEGMYAYAVQHGDLEMAKHIGEVVKETVKVPKAAATMQHVPGVGLVDVSDPNNPRVVMAAKKDAHIINAQEGIFEQREDGVYDAATGKKFTGTLHPVPLAPAFTPQTITGASGDPVVAPFNSKTGTMGAPVAMGKPSSHAQTAQNMASEALLRSSASEMAKSDAMMREYEGKLANGTASINGVAQFLGGLGNAFTHDDPASRAIQNSALTALNKANPELARYIRRGLSFAEGEAGISKRPSDFRTKMATFLSTAAAGASPEMISDIQGRRSSILDPIQSVLSGSTPKGSGSATGPKKPSSLDAYRHLLK